VKDMADATVENDGSIEELYAKLDEFLVQYI
jgi:dephospho-CoA kinase